MENEIFVRPYPPATPEELRALIRKYRHRSMFIRQVKTRFYGSPEGIELISSAYNWNSDVFKGKFRECGESYMNGHLVPVAALLMIYWEITDASMIAAALSHDSIEDIDWVTRVNLEIEFNARTAFIVSAVTKPNVPDGMSKKSVDYSHLNIANIEAGGVEAVILKCLADRLHNMLTLWGSYEKREWKILETEEYFLPLARKYDLPTKELELAIIEQKQKLYEMNQS